MIAFEAMEQERLAFLYELYTRSAGDARQGVPYEALVDALGFGERVTKRIQRELQREGLVELTAVPRMTTVGRPVMDHAHRPSHPQTIGMTPQGMRLMEAILTNLSDTALPHPQRLNHRNGQVLVDQEWDGLCRFSSNRLLQTIFVTLQVTRPSAPAGTPQSWGL